MEGQDWVGFGMLGYMTQQLLPVQKAFITYNIPAYVSGTR